MTAYAAIRTDRSFRDLILAELQQGRLRQGWGWEDRHDLRELRRRRQEGKALDDHERSAWLNRRLYEETWDGLQDGDIVLLPNLPADGSWLIARIDGAYAFDRSPGFEGHGHVRPMKIVRRPNGELGVVHPTFWRVPAGLRRSTRVARRMWSLDPHSEAVEEIVAAIERGETTATPTDAEERFDRLADDVRAHAGKLIDQAFGAAEFEHVVVRVLGAHYRASHPQAQVEHTGGPAEHGVDLLIRYPDPLGMTLEVGVQVKKHKGTEWSLESLEQLCRARERRGIHAGVIVTTAEETNEGFDAARNQLEDDLKIPIKVILRDEFIDLMLTHLGDGAEQRAGASIEVSR